ncbi:MAG: Methylcobamide:CoM methyltransferase [Promethearchaeota archaeon]|nr:MAG: Methylcobamide:CoM methyltransferase [Candidatus Lokiarchaeota archaeon]
MKEEMNSAERVFTTMDHEEPDRVPFTLNLNLHGAKLLAVSLKEYFSKPENLVKAQIHFKKKYDIDIVSSFFYTSLEFEAFGGTSIFYEDGPPNAGRPIFRNKKDIMNFKTPEVYETSETIKILETTKLLKEEFKDEVAILGVATSPFSLPVMQLGFKNYIDLIYDDQELFETLIDKNEKFCIEFSNAQLEAGADAIAYIDPMSSPSIIPKDLLLKTGLKIAKRTIEKIQGNVAFHHASAQNMEIIDVLKELGIVGFAASSFEDLSKLKRMCKNELTIMGNLNGIEMCRWNPEQAKNKVLNAIRSAGAGGGFILTDNHGEIPYQVPEKIIETISKTVKKFGKYPLTGIK